MRIETDFVATQVRENKCGKKYINWVERPARVSCEIETPCFIVRAMAVIEKV